MQDADTQKVANVPDSTNAPYVGHVGVILNKYPYLPLSNRYAPFNKPSSGTIREV